MLYPVLPIFLTQILHASGSVVGLVEGVAQATQNIVQGFSGWLSDKLQKRKSFALAGYFLSAVAKPLMGLATARPGVRGDGFWTGLAPDSALLRAMRSSHLPQVRKTEGELLVLKVLEIIYSTYQFAAYLLTRQHFLVFIEDLLAD